MYANGSEALTLYAPFATTGTETVALKNPEAFVVKVPKVMLPKVKVTCEFGAKYIPEIIMGSVS
jgi:hypothetical protein